MSQASSPNKNHKNRILYILEAGLEYWISLLLTGSFFARLLTENGISDAAAGIITEISSFAFIAQLISVFYRKRRGMKRFITFMHLCNQLFFVFLYAVPLFSVPQGVKTALFILLFLGGQLIANTVSPYKISWFMSFVDNAKRGRFTALKEIVSLAGGMLFSFTMGTIHPFDRGGKRRKTRGGNRSENFAHSRRKADFFKQNSSFIGRDGGSVGLFIQAFHRVLRRLSGKHARLQPPLQRDPRSDLFGGADGLFVLSRQAFG